MYKNVNCNFGRIKVSFLKSNLDNYDLYNEGCSLLYCNKGFSAFRSLILDAYVNADIVLTLPDGVTVNDINWLSVWCRQAAVSRLVH